MGPIPHRKLAGLILALAALLPAAPRALPGMPGAGPAAAQAPPPQASETASAPAAGAPAAPERKMAPSPAAPSPAAAAVPDLPQAKGGEIPAAPVNLDFEQGEVGQMPAGWEMTAGSERAGFGAELTDEQPYQGRRAALVHTVVFSDPPATGTLMQRFAAGVFRGRRVRFRAAVRTEQGSATSARLWLAVERPGRPAGFLDDMADRPITGTRWQLYEVVGDVAADATVIGIGLSVGGDGRAWIDAASFDDLGPAGAGEAAPGPLGGRAVTNLVAFARLLGYVRYFHPSDEAAAVDWASFAAAGAAQVSRIGQAASTSAPAEQDGLGAVLMRLFAPVAPTLRLYPTGSRPPSLDLAPPAGAAPGTVQRVWWRHTGLGAGAHSPFFASIRVRGEAGPPAPGEPDPRVPFTADLGGGISCVLPLALHADATGTLPHSAVPPAGTSAAPEAASLSPTDRNGRLATVILAWNVVQHFHPGLPAGGGGWLAALPAALREAAAGSGVESLLAALRRMVAATRDGQAAVAATGDPAAYGLPLRWDWIDGRLVIAAVAGEAGGAGSARTDAGRSAGAAAGGAAGGSGAGGTAEKAPPPAAAGLASVHPGAVVLRLGGRDVQSLLRAAEAETAAGTPQLRRWRALSRLGLGAAGQTVTLTIEESAAGPTGTAAAPASSTVRREVTLTHSLPAARLPAMTSQPDAIHEASPGVLVVDLARLGDRELAAALPRLAAATGIVFDLRGYVRSTDLLLAHLIAAPAETRRELIPHWAGPDRGAVTYTPVAAPVPPAEPRIKARLAFISSVRDTGPAESFLATAAALHLGPIVGEPTGGATGTLDSAPLPGGLTLVWTATLPQGGAAAAAGIPIQPTVPAAPTRQGLAAGRDEVLEKALSLVTPAAHS